MPRFTSAYSSLLVRFNEIEVLLRLARLISASIAISIAAQQIDAICRSGVLLMSGHVEGYIEELGNIAIVRIGNRGLAKQRVSTQFKYYLSRDLIKAIKDSSNPRRISSNLDALLLRDLHIWDSTPVFSAQISSDVFLSDFSNPTHDRIKRFFSRFGYAHYQGDLERRMGANFLICRNMLDQVVDQRNKIAHGNTITTGTPTDLSQMLLLVKLYCREADCVVADWFRSIGCPIR
jgi:hypothetical protein